MEIKEAQKFVDERVKEYGGYWEPLSMFTRLVEETGEFGRAINLKFGGKKKKFEEDGRELEEEISDVFFTLLALSNRLEIDLEKEFLNKVEKTHKQYKEIYTKND